MVKNSQKRAYVIYKRPLLLSLFQRLFFIHFFSCLDILIQQSQVVPGQNTSLWHSNKPLCLGRMITTCQKVIRRELCMDKQRRLDEGIFI